MALGPLTLRAARRERLFKKINENSTVYKTLASGEGAKGGAKKKVRAEPSGGAPRLARGPADAARPPFAQTGNSGSKRKDRDEDEARHSSALPFSLSTGEVALGRPGPRRSGRAGKVAGRGQ